MTLLDLAPELLFCIIDQLGLQRDINALARSNRAFYNRLNPWFYRSSVQQSDSKLLLWAARRGRIETTKKLLEGGANVEVQDEEGDAALAVALKYNAEDNILLLTKLLISHGANVNARNFSGSTPLMRAVFWGSIPTAAFLIQHGANVNLTDDLGRTALFAAACHNKSALVEWLLARGDVKVELADAYDHTVLSQVLYNNWLGDMAKLLIRSGRFNLNAKTGGWRITPLCIAARYSTGDVVKAVLESEWFDLKLEQMHTKSAAIFCAVSARNVHTVKALASVDALALDVVEEDSRTRRTPFFHAVSNGYLEVATTLLASTRVDVNARDYRGYTPLLDAAEQGRVSLVEMLLNTNKVDLAIGSRMAIILASRNGHTEVVKRLLSYKAVDCNTRDDQGSTALSWAARKGHEAVVAILLADQSIEPDLVDENNRTPLAWAAKDGCAAVANLLLADRRVDPNAKDNDDQTPLLWAAAHGHAHVVNVLLQDKRVDIELRSHKGQAPILMAAMELLTVT